MHDLNNLIASVKDLLDKELYQEIVVLLNDEVLQEHDNAFLYELRGYCFDSLFQFDQAICDYTELIRLNPKSDHAFRNRGWTWYRKKEFDKAIGDFTEAIRLNPESSITFIDRGNSWDRKKEFDKAIHDFTEAIRLNPIADTAFMDRGNSWDQKKEFDKAIHDFTEAIRLNPIADIAFNNRGRIWYSKKEFDNAIDDFNDAVRLNPENDIAFYNRGLAWSGKGEFDKAINDYTEAIRLNQKNDLSFSNRAGAWHNKKELDKAIHDFTEAIRLNPKNSRAFHDRGLVWHDKKDPEKAIDDFTEAIRLNPQYDLAFYNRGIVYHEKKEFDKAIFNYKKTIQINHELSHPYFYLGQAYHETDSHHLGSGYYKRAFSLGHPIQNFITVFASKYFSPFILREIITGIVSAENISIYDNEILTTEKTCEQWLIFLNYVDLFKTYLNKTTNLRLKAVVNYYMGHSIKAFSIYDNEIDEAELSLRDQYYFALSAADFLEPNKGILHFAIKQAETSKELSREELYYAGQLYCLDMQYAKAETCFQKAGLYLPALYGLVSIYKLQKNFSEIRRLATEIGLTETSANDFSFLNGITPIKIKPDTSKEAFTENFRQKLFYYELQEEINVVRAIVNPNIPYKHLEFYELIEWNDNLKESIEAKIEKRNIQVLEKELVRVFSEKTNEISIDEINKEVENNNDAKTIVLRTEQHNQRFNTTAEKELAIAISELKEPAEWYILLIKYFYLTKKLSARSAIILYYYVLKVARQKKDKTSTDVVSTEVKSWIQLISIALKSPLVVKVMITVWVNLVNEKPGKKLNQFKDYQDFKRRFRTDYLAWWREDLFKNELDKQNINKQE